MFALVIACFCGCSLLTLEREAREYFESTVLVGRVECATSCDGPLVVAALAARDQQFEVAANTALHEPGGYELIVPAGRYALFAFLDGNRNGIFDAGEPSGGYLGETPVAAPGTGVVSSLDFVINDDPNADRRVTVARGTRLVPASSVMRSTQAGAIADLDTYRFSADNGRRGYWAPMTFFRESGGNVFFLEPYDPSRIPILFVHGAAGSAQDWRRFFEGIDRSRYQAWFFQYPSGATVESMAYLIYWKLYNLRLRYRFDTLYLTAHSMGGLVVRKFLVDHGALFPQIRLFVSVSTPWAGEPSADLGVRHSPAVVPSWRDMQPDGRFLRSLFERMLPASTDYYLLFGHRGGYSMLRPNHDGTVTLASQLRDPAQREAKRVFGFDEDHESILKSPQVVDTFRSILEQTRTADDAGGGPTGRIRLELDWTRSDDRSAQQSVLMLTAEPGQGRLSPEPVTIALSADDSGREIGPIPFGSYSSSVIASAFRAEPASALVEIGETKVPSVAFRLIPDGRLSGYVAADIDGPELPAGAYRPPHPTLRLREITLEGPEVRRRLQPRQSGERHTLAHAARGEDDAVGSTFSFVGLKAGDYDLTIEADGYRTFKQRYRVEPGRPSPLATIVLERLSTSASSSAGSINR